MFEVLFDLGLNQPDAGAMDESIVNYGGGGNPEVVSADHQGEVLPVLGCDVSEGGEMSRIDLVACLVSSGHNDQLKVQVGVLIIIMAFKATTGISHFSVLSICTGGSRLYVVIYVFLTTQRELRGNVIAVAFVVAANAKGDIVISAPSVAAVFKGAEAGADVGD